MDSVTKTTMIVLAAILIFGAASSALADSQSIKVTVDPRMELLSAVQLVSGYQDKYPGLITRFDFPYKQKMADYFGKYKDHRAVRLFDEMSKKGFNYDTPPSLMLCLSDLPALELRSPSGCFSPEYSKHLLESCGGEKQMREFVDALRDFARVTDFQKFFDANADTYKAIIDEADNKVRSLDVIGPVQNYYGSKRLLATIVLAPLFSSGGYGPKVERSDGALEVFSICGPSGVQGSQPSWGAPEYIRELAWHEFGHSFVNPLADKHNRALAKYSSLFNPIASPMRGQSYGNWQICINEHVLRAVCARLIYKVQGSKAAEKCVEGESNLGFAYVKLLCKRLEDYEKHRDKYPTLESVFPELIGVFKSLHESLRTEQLGADIYGMKIEIGEPGISPDGARIAYPLLGLDKNGKNWISRVWVSDLAGSSKKRIAQVPCPLGLAPPCVAWFDNSHVIVSAPYTNLIQIVSLDGKQRSVSIPDSYFNLGLAVSPNRKWGAFPAFSKQSEQRGGIFLLNIETGAIRTLSHDTVGPRLSWSPDSSKLAFGESGDPGQLYKEDCPPSFAPANYRNLKICDIETGTVTDTGLKGAGAAWSPDGKWLAYTSMAAGKWWGYGVPHDGSIVKMNAETRETKTLTEPGVNKRTDQGLDVSGSLLPLWSPDGRRIAYRRIHREDGTMRIEHEIWVMNADGTGRKKLRDEWSPFVWAPDAEAIFVSKDTGIERIAVDTGGP